MTKKKILVITRAYGQHAGGMERLSWEFVDALQKDELLEISVLAHKGLTKTAPFFVLCSLPTALWKARQVDAVHLGDPVLSLAGWLIKKLLKKTVAVTVHGLDVSYASFFYRLYLKLFFRNFNFYFPISQHAKKLLDKWHVRGSVSVLTPGVIDRYFDSTITWPGTDKIILLTVGRLVKRKGHEWFIRHVLSQLPPSYDYLIAGSGPEQLAIEQAVRDTGLGDRVHLLGRVSDEELRKFYNSVSAFVQPNVTVASDAEGFGLVLLEAALCERPVFAAATEGITDAIQHGLNGTLLPSGDAASWITALSTASFVAQRAARQYTLEHFPWPARIAQYRQALFSLDQAPLPHR